MGCSWGSKTPKNRDVFYFVAHVFFLSQKFLRQKKNICHFGHISTPSEPIFMTPHQKIGNEKLPMGQYGPFSRKLSQSFLKFEKPKISAYDKFGVFFCRIAIYMTYDFYYGRFQCADFGHFTIQSCHRFYPDPNRPYFPKMYHYGGRKWWVRVPGGSRGVKLGTFG